MRSSLRAAVHSRINSTRKNGIANNTGSRICSGRTDRKPAIAFTPLPYDVADLCLKLKHSRHRVVVVSGVPMHSLDGLLQRELRNELLEPGRRVSVAEQVGGQRDRVVTRATGVDTAQHQAVAAKSGALHDLRARVLLGFGSTDQLQLVRL